MIQPQPARPGRPRIAVYAIAKNEEPLVERWFASTAGADAVVLVDTGSVDRTPARARELDATVHEINVEPFRYDVARNRALALVPAGIDLCVSLDLDEVLTEGWRAQLEAAWRAGATRVRCRYEWPWSDSYPPLRFTMVDRIHARHGYSWRYPVHEEIVPDREDVIVASSLLIRHLRDSIASRPQYLQLLRIRAAEHPDDGHTAHLLASEARLNGLREEAIAHERRALALPLPPNDRLHAQLVLAHLEPDAREAWLLTACAERPERREPWCELAQMHLERGEWRACRAAAHAALRITDPADDHLTNPFAWGPWPEHLAARASLELGDLDWALHHARRSVRLAPSDPTQIALYDRVLAALRPSSGPVQYRAAARYR
jgi:tetratricopeptide (TPR) repeat protein